MAQGSIGGSSLVKTPCGTPPVFSSRQIPERSGGAVVPTEGRAVCANRTAERASTARIARVKLRMRCCISEFLPLHARLFFEFDPVFFIAQRLLRKVRLEAGLAGESRNVLPVRSQFVDFLCRPGLRKRLGIFEPELDLQSILGHAAESLHHVQRIAMRRPFIVH